MFPLGTALLPGQQLPLRIFEPRYRQMLADCRGPDAVYGPDHDGNSGFGVVLIARGHEVGGGDMRHDVGTFATIDTATRDTATRDTATENPAGGYLLSCVGTWRFQVVQWLPDDPYPRAIVRALAEPEVTDDHTRSLLELGARIREVVGEAFTRRGQPVPPGIPGFDADDLTERGVFGWAQRLPIGAADRQDLLAAADTTTRIQVFADAVETLAARIRFAE